MKKYLGLVLLATLTLTACGTKQNKTENSIKDSSEEISQIKEIDNSSELKTSKSSQKKDTSKQDLDKILSTDNPQKYLDAYQEYTMQDNPMPPEQRGSWPILDKSGFNSEENWPIYSEIFWGICDYYGGAFQKGLITAEQNEKTQEIAKDKLNNGNYIDLAKPIETKEKNLVTKENVIEYADNYVKKYAPNWEGEFILEEELSDGSFQLFYDSRGAARGKFVVYTDGTVNRFDMMGNQLKSLEEL